MMLCEEYIEKWKKEEIEKEEADDDADQHAEADDGRALYVAQEKNGDHTDEEESQRKILLQVGDRIVQQFRLVTADVEIDIGIECHELLGDFSQRLFEIGHVLVRLLDDGQGNRPLAVGQ